MAKNQETATPAPVPNTMGGMGDLSVIRNILFGQQAAEFESQFGTMTERLNKTDADVEARFRNLEAEMNRRLDDLEKRLNSRIRTLEDNLAQAVMQLNSTIAQTSRDDKAMIGNLLVELGQKLV
ncbi:MAG: hypothetical protein ACK4Q5_18405 [Saprospiraceae bacterium]